MADLLDLSQELRLWPVCCVQRGTAAGSWAMVSVRWWRWLWQGINPLGLGCVVVVFSERDAVDETRIGSEQLPGGAGSAQAMLLWVWYL